MSKSEFAQAYTERMFPDIAAPAGYIDPEFEVLFDNFAFDEVITEEGRNVPAKDRFLAILATLVGASAVDEYALMLPAALNFGLIPDEVVELIYQAVPYLGIGRVRPFFKVTNKIFDYRGETITDPSRSTITGESRLEKGVEKQVEIFGEALRNSYQEGPEDTRHIKKWLANMFGDYYTRKGLSVAHREMITFSKFLATIKIDVPIKLDMKALVREEPNEEELRKIFEEMEFRTLIDRVLKKSNAPSPSSAAPDLFSPGPLFTQNNGPVQGNLFEEFAGDRPDDEKKSNLARLETSDFDYQLIDTEEKRSEIIKKLLTTKILSIDTETTSAEPMEAELVGMSFSDTENQAYYVPVPPEREEALKIVNEFRPLYENENSMKVGQNIKYDILVLQNYGVEVKGELFDTMLAHYVLQPELRHNMDYLAEIYLHYQTIHIDELIGPKGKNQKNMRDLPPEEVYKYACEDADITLKLKNVLEEELKKQGVEHLFYEIEMPLVRVLANMESNGVRIDTEALKQTSEHFTVRLQEIEKEIYELAGETFNIASPKQVGEILFDKLKIIDKAKKTKTGQYVTSEEVLESLRNKHEVIGKILEYRGLKKLLGTYVDALPLLINPRTRRIHTSFNQAVTATGRLSSSSPNLQNIPIRDEDGKEIRKAFIPDDGCEFFSADYSQIELRIMAHLSEDKNMIDAFLSGYDIHAATAAKIYKIDIKDVTSDMRRKAKTANFGIIYGISIFGLAERMNVDRKEAKELIDGYFETYPQVREYMDKSIQVAREQGYVETIFHRKRFLPDINSRNATVRGYAERNAINAPIQGSAADIIKVAMARIYERFQSYKLKAKMILQVHDELNFSVPEAEKEFVQQIVIEEMERAYRMHVPLRADCGWGKNWLKAH